MAINTIVPPQTPAQLESESEFSILTVAEAAAVLRVSKNHLYAIINGQVPGVTALPVIRLGRRRLVRRESLQTWLSENNQSRN